MGSLKRVLAKNVSSKRKNLTQTELAEKADLSFRMLQKIEYQEAWPSEETLLKIAQALGCAPWELFMEEKVTELDRAYSQTIQAQALELKRLADENKKLAEMLDQNQSGTEQGPINQALVIENAELREWKKLAQERLEIALETIQVLTAGNLNLPISSPTHNKVEVLRVKKDSGT